MLALQDRMLHSALRAAGLGAGGAEGTDLHGGRSQRFSSLLLSGGGGGGGMEPGSASEEELRRLDSLGIKYDSKVAAAAVSRVCVCVTWCKGSGEVLLCSSN